MDAGVAGDSGATPGAGRCVRQSPQHRPHGRRP